MHVLILQNILILHKSVYSQQTPREQVQLGDYGESETQNLSKSVWLTLFVENAKLFSFPEIA